MSSIIAVWIIVGLSIGSGFGIVIGSAGARARAQMNCLERATAAGLDRATTYRVCSRGRLRAARLANRRGRV